MKEFLREKVLWAAALVCFGAMTAGFPFYEVEPPLMPGSFAGLFQKALDTQMVLFLIPVLSVLPFGAAYVRETSTGFLKLYITRSSKMEYIKRKTFQVYAGGFLPFFLAGLFLFVLCFLFLYPMERKGSIDTELLLEAFQLLLRICLAGGMMAEVSGIFAVAFRNYYMAYGLPFVCYYMLIILKERFWQDMYAMYPGEWISNKQMWGADGNGIFLFFLAFTAAVMLLHGLLLYYRLQEI